MATFVKGTCTHFCPAEEAKQRIAEKLLHYYELKNGQRNVPGTLVKAFSRSAAGVRAPKANNLRTERCLRQTVEYLLRDVLLNKQRTYHFAYDFIFDRLRAVRQEIVIQNYTAQQTKHLLEPMVMFLAYSRYKLCVEPMDNFDPKICEQHLLECLKRVLCCYDELPTTADLNVNELRSRAFLEALYQVFNLGTTEALKRALALPPDVRQDATFRTAFSIAMNYYQGNWYRVTSGIQKLPHVICAVAALKMQIIRRKIYEIFAHAYNNKQLTVPADFLVRLTCHSSKEELFADCKHYNISIPQERHPESVRFARTDFKADALHLKERHEPFAEEKLARIYLPEVLLLKKF